MSGTAPDGKEGGAIGPEGNLAFESAKSGGMNGPEDPCWGLGGGRGGP